MNKLKFGILIITIFVFGCRNNINEISVSGKFTGDIPHELTYSVPVNGICYEFFNKSTPVDSLGNFEFRVQSEEPCFITLFVNGNRGQLVAEPGKSYEVTIHKRGNKNNYTFNCNNTKLQQEYQRLSSPLHPQFEAMKIWELPLEKAKGRTDSMYNNEISVFKSLVTEGELSRDLFNLIQLDRKIFYSNVLAQVAVFKFVNAKRKNRDANTDSINKTWEAAALRVNPGTENFLNSKWAYYYFWSNYLLLKEYTGDDFSWDVRSEANKEGLFHTYLLDIARTYLEKDNLEFYTAAYILSMARQDKFEKELIDLYRTLNTEFSDSKYVDYLEPEIKKIVDYHEKVAGDFDEEIKFVKGYEKFKNLEQCTELFKGSKLYVDIWSTSCGPCKEEFKHEPELAEFLKAKNIKQLYISLDSDIYEKRWKEMIKYYNLKGNHIRASEELKHDFREIHGFTGIPRYLLIDENGKIVVDNASRPSQLKKLEKQINEML